MPLSMTQHEHMPPVSMPHRFCIMLQAILSSHEQVTFIPPGHFSNFSVQRGTIIQLPVAGAPAGAPTVGVPTPGTPMAGIPIPVRSIITLDIPRPPFVAPPPEAGALLRGRPSVGPP